MTRISVGAPFVVVVLALASAGAGAATRPPVALTAAPGRVVLAGSTRTTVRVTNEGTKRVLVDVRRAGFALDLRGRPRIVRNGGARSATRWLTLHPTRFALGPRGSVSLVVASRLPRRAEPGDHDALVLLATRPLGNSRLAVRLRLGVVVVVRAPGRVVRRLELRGLRVARHGRRRALQLSVANRGNVTESLERARAVVSLAHSRRRVTTLVANDRELRPRTSGILEFAYRGRRHGLMNVRVVVRAGPGRPVLRGRYRIRM
jgi:hypothetical protein